MLQVFKYNNMYAFAHWGQFIERHLKNNVSIFGPLEMYLH